MSTRKPMQEHPLKAFSWLLTPVVSVLLAFVVSAIKSPTDRLEKLDDRVARLEVSKATAEEQTRSIREVLAELRAQQLMVAGKLDDLRAEVIAQRRK